MFRRFLWTNGTVIRAEHLNSIYDYIGSWISECISGPGIISMNIDLLALKENILKINSIEAILNDYTYINNTNLTLDISNIVQKTYISLEIDEEKITTSNKTCKDEIIISWVESTPQAKLVVGNLYPILEIDIKNGEYVFTSFEPKFIRYNNSHQIMQRCQNILVQIQHQIQKLQYSTDKSDIALLSFVANELYIAMQVQKFETIYSALLRALNGLSKNFYMMKITSLNVLNDICDKIEYCLSINNKNDYVADFILKDNIYMARIDKIGKIKIIIEPVNEDIKEWAENTIIASENMIEQAQMKRVKGLNRTCTVDHVLIIDLDTVSEYFSINYNLCIIGGVSLKRISLFIE